MIGAEGIARRLGGLEELGVGSQGVVRMAWSEEDAATRAWFTDQAGELGLTVERDPAGNLWACPAEQPPWWAVGSHLDSVRGGGRFDGPLGVASGFEIAASCAKPIAVLSFADEEGARFNTPTFGSKALAGKLDIAGVIDRRDDHGVALGEAMRASGVEPEGIAEAPRWLQKLAGFVEIHIDQTTELARARAPIGIVSSLASRRRLEVDLRGQADHAGTTPRAERRDALSAAAHLIVAAEELAEGVGELTFTASRIVAEPNAPTTIAAHVRLWLDARAPDPDAVAAWARRVAEEAVEIALRTRVEITISEASRSDGVEFSDRVRSALRRASEDVVGGPVPEVVCFAGHDAGVLSDVTPAGMVLVRNATGISHSPEESVDLGDAAVAARAVAGALAGLAADVV
jgi:beta-ureidopropionase / N-carbamoyl-L-amino-acid hydrolase